jgi:Protein of unknown function (DUF3486)
VAPKRRRKSTVTRLPEAQRLYIERKLREGRLTLDELIADLQTQFPGEPAAAVSRSALGRFDQQIEAASSALVGALGEGFGEKSGEYLTQAITVLGIRAANRAANNEEDFSIKDVKDLALMAKNTFDAKRMNVAQRQLIQQEAREALLREQSAKLDKIVKSGGLSAETAKDLRQKILGVT